MNHYKMTITLYVLADHATTHRYIHRAIRDHLYQLATNEATARKTRNFIYGIEEIDGPTNFEQTD